MARLTEIEGIAEGYEKTGEEGRHHVHESIIRKAVNGAVRKAGLAKHATCHTRRNILHVRILRPNCRRGLMPRFRGPKA